MGGELPTREVVKGTEDGYCDNNFFFFIQSFDYCFARYKIAHAAKGYGVKKPLWRPQSSPKPKTKKITKEKARSAEPRWIKDDQLQTSGS
jgi:hypothetical protein